jgi:hypothetical protein
MPPTSIRDLVIKDDDLVIGTHGRSFWILDDITPLRQMSASIATEKAILFKPQTALRVRWNSNTDTPMPQEEPGGQNPPDGAIFNYYLSEKSTTEVTLEILDAAGKSVRKYSSNDKPYEIPDVNIPLYWIRPQTILSADAGAHRFIWDLHYTELNEPAAYPMTAIYKNTPPSPTSPWVLPGNYTVKLTANGKTISQSFTVKMDPRVKASMADLQKQFSLSMTCYEGRTKAKDIAAEAVELRKTLKSKSASPETMKALDQELSSFEGGSRSRRGATAQAVPTPAGVESAFAGLFGILHETEMTPTTQTVSGVKQINEQLTELSNKFSNLKSRIALLK